MNKRHLSESIAGYHMMSKIIKGAHGRVAVCTKGVIIEEHNP